MRWTDELFPARAATVALGVMGLLAAMLAVTGIFGMAAYSVSRRMKELGIRVALGARQDAGDERGGRAANGAARRGIGRWVCWRESSRAACWGRSCIRRIRGIPWWWAARC